MHSGLNVGHQKCSFVLHWRPRGAIGKTPALSALRVISRPSSSIHANPETHPIGPVIMGTIGWSPGVFVTNEGILIINYARIGQQ